MKKSIALFFFVASFSTTYAQIERHLGFKTGLSFSHFDGPTAAGETWENLTGFHIGASLAWTFGDYFGLRSELNFDRRGSKYTFDGPGHFTFLSETGQRIVATGNATWRLNINNSYADLPVMAFVRFKKIELSAGPGIGLLASSTADGNLTFTGKTASGSNADLSEIRLKYNFRRDDVGEGEGDLVTHVLDGQTTKTPSTLGAYHQLAEATDPVYSPLNLSLNAGLSFFLNRSLFLGFRVNYGLNDVTRNTADRDLGQLDAQKKPVFSSDVDKTFGFQGSIGFSF